MSMSSPSITYLVAVLGSLLCPVLYVAPFYLSPTLRTSSTVSRDAPRVIQARVRAVGIVCAVCTASTILLLTLHGHFSLWQTLHMMGIFPVVLADVPRALLLTAILFVGPLYEQIIVNREHRAWSLSALRWGIWESWSGYRNLLIAPASEELVFRSLSVAMYLAAGRSIKEIVFVTPLIFGIAHVHHLVDFVRSHTPAGQSLPPVKLCIMGLVQSLVQFSYTSLFGFFAAFVLLRTGNLFACIVVHTFCNWQGVPRVWGRVGAPDDDRSSSTGIAASVVYYLLLPAGAYAFYLLLWPLTASSNALVSF